MDPRRKKIYLILIVCCLVLSVGILGYTFLGGGSAAPDPSLVVNNAPQVPRAASGNAIDGFQAPSVFPVNKDIDNDVLKSQSYVRLKPYAPLDVSNQLGRSNPFRSY